MNKDHVGDWRNWCQYLNEHTEDVKETMRSENCIYERCVIFDTLSDWYAVGTVEHNGEQQLADMTVQLNRDHKRNRDLCLGSPIAKFRGEFQLPLNHEILYEFQV